MVGTISSFPSLVFFIVWWRFNIETAAQNDKMGVLQRPHDNVKYTITKEVTKVKQLKYLQYFSLEKKRTWERRI
jgi:hypothetical protein